MIFSIAGALLLLFVVWCCVAVIPDDEDLL